LELTRWQWAQLTSGGAEMFGPGEVDDPYLGVRSPEFQDMLDEQWVSRRDPGAFAEIARALRQLETDVAGEKVVQKGEQMRLRELGLLPPATAGPDGGGGGRPGMPGGAEPMEELQPMTAE